MICSLMDKYNKSQETIKFQIIDLNKLFKKNFNSYFFIYLKFFDTRILLGLFIKEQFIQIDLYNFRLNVKRLDN